MAIKAKPGRRILKLEWLRLKALRQNKGIFFSITALLIIFVLFFVLRPKTDLYLMKEGITSSSRIADINNFITDMESIYLKSIIEAVTYNSLMSLTYYMEERNTFLADLNAEFKEVAINGTIKKEQIDSITNKVMMANNTLVNWTARLKGFAGSYLNVDANFSIVDAWLNQTNPWQIDSKIILSYTVVSESAKWSRINVSIVASMPIAIFYDPQYYVNTGGGYIKRPIMSNTFFGKWNNTEIMNMISNETYFHWENSNAPSFLMRFVNSSNSSQCCGIESAVNPARLPPALQSDVPDSYIDYHFWNNTYRPRCSKLYNLTEIWGQYNGFKMDFNEIVRYNASGYKTTC